jgi:DNA-binding CsgD family transcriptional regulator
MKTTIITLSVRERQVLLLLALDCTRAEAAELLGLKENGVKSHRRNIGAKLGVDTTAAAVLIACHHGWIGYC